MHEKRVVEDFREFGTVTITDDGLIELRTDTPESLLKRHLRFMTYRLVDYERHPESCVAKIRPTAVNVIG